MKATKAIQKKKLLAPPLRFKEYNDAWEIKKLGKLVQIKSGYSPSNYEFVDHGTYPFLKVEELNNSEKYQKTSRFYSNDKENLIRKNSVIFPKRGAAILNNKVRITAVDVLMDTNLMAITPISEDLNYEFLYYKIFLEKLYKIADTSTIPQINNKHIEPYEIPLPKRQEQKKIASFLSVVDEKIQQLTLKRELLEKYKRGSMRKFFSRKMRFKDEKGNAYPKWEDKRLEGMLSFVVDNRGKTPPITIAGYPMIEINAIGKKAINYSQVEKFVSEEVYNTWFRKYLEPGDILFSTVGATALCSIYDSSKVAVIAQNLVGLRFKIENELFMFYLLTEERNNHKFKRIEMGAVQPSVKVSQIIHIHFDVPVLEEQKKIANYLSSIDTKVELVNSQITQTQTFKKGLLQQMFV